MIQAAVRTTRTQPTDSLTPSASRQPASQRPADPGIPEGSDYFGVRGYAKVSIGVGRGRNVGDQRQYLKEKDAKREMRNERS